LIFDFFYQKEKSAEGLTGASVFSSRRLSVGAFLFLIFNDVFCFEQNSCLFCLVMYLCVSQQGEFKNTISSSFEKVHIKSFLRKSGGKKKIPCRLSFSGFFFLICWSSFWPFFSA
jgi:hypothetical protein